jgi:hypothetical protein
MSKPAIKRPARQPAYSGPLVRRSFTKHLDKTWSWQVYVFAVPTAMMARYIISGTAHHHNRTAAKQDLQTVLDTVGLGQAPAP